MRDTEAMQDEIEQAAEGAGHTFNGARLQPFSFARQACWQRLRYDQVESVFEAACAIVFICTLGEELADANLTGRDLIDSARGEEGIRAFRRRLESWAEGLELSANNDLGRECNRLGNVLWSESTTSRFKPVIDPGGKPPDPNG